MNSPVVQFCIDECKRQNDYTIEAVCTMVEAWCNTVALLLLVKTSEKCSISIDMELIKYLGKTIKPQYNSKGFRQTAVIFRNGKTGVYWTQIPRCLSQLIQANLSPDEFYKEFEEVHPFEDGNGRVGAIIWNLMSGNLTNPKCPPDFFKE